MTDTYQREYACIEDGMVMGEVSTDKVGSSCTFEICSVEEAEEMNDRDFEEFAQQALYESGMMSWSY